MWIEAVKKTFALFFTHFLDKEMSRDKRMIARRASDCEKFRSDFGSWVLSQPISSFRLPDLVFLMLFTVIEPMLTRQEQRPTIPA